MAEFVQILGKECIEYKDKQTQENKSFWLIHVAHVSAKESKNLVGTRVETIPCPKEVPPSDLTLGCTYELEYEHYKVGNGRMARICGFELAEAV